MVVRTFISVLLLSFLASAALAKTPSLEQLHDLLLAQQELDKQQNARLEALEKELAEQKMLVASQQRMLLAQAEKAMAQKDAVAALTQRAETAETELAQVQTVLATAQPAARSVTGPPQGNGYLAQAGPMTASLAPEGPQKQEQKNPYSITAGVEYLLASSDSFRFSSANGGGNVDGGKNERDFDFGYLLGLTYNAPSGITWGGDLHYWEESEHTITTSEANQFISLGTDPLSADTIQAEVDAQRLYGSLYARGNVASSMDWQLDLLGGLRAAYLAQSISARDVTDATEWVDSDTEYYGLGPYLGVAMDWDILQSFGLVGSAEMTMLVGESTAKSTSHDGGTTRHRKDTLSLDTVWMFTSRVGMDYNLPLEHSDLTFELGLNLEYWSGIPDHPRWNDDVATSAAFGETDILFMGPYFDFRWSF